MNDRMPHFPEDQASEFARLGAIARVAIAKGWGHYAERLGFGSPGAAGEDGPPRSDAVRLREALEELGPTFVKFGQTLSMRSDVFSDELATELAKLQDAATTFPAEAARRIIEEETGKPLAEIYASFDDLPMAAASMAQVHCATLPDGTSVIVSRRLTGMKARSSCLGCSGRRPRCVCLPWSTVGGRVKVGAINSWHRRRSTERLGLSLNMWVKSKEWRNHGS